jgi:hypothetical protein
MKNESKKTEKSETEMKTIDFREEDNKLERQSKLTKAGGILGLVLGTACLAAGIFLPKEINTTLERVLEFSCAGLGYAGAVGNYAAYRLNQINTTLFHLTPEYTKYMDKHLQSLMGC